MDYTTLLKKAKAQLPATAVKSERFEIPQVTGHLQGNKTIVTNFGQICTAFNRPQEQILKYLQRELATPATIEGPRLVLGRKISSQLINQKVIQYAKDFVICKECGKPDTKLEKEDKYVFLKCLACGAKNPVKSKI